MKDNTNTPENPDWDKMLDYLEAKVLKGEVLTTAQQQQLEELRALVKETGEALHLYNTIDINRNWREVQARINETMLQRHLETTTEKRKAIPLWTRIATVAAAVAFIIFGVYYLKTQNQPKEESYYTNDVNPGASGATLTLSNGKQIKLTDAITGELAKEAGITITKTKGGQIQYELKGSDKDPNKINTLTTAKGETYILTLPDQTKVWLNAASSLTYAASLNERGRRIVKLIGEAYFEVAKDKVHPFVVESRGQEVEVLGTHFNVNAYDDEPAISTTLLEGSVQITAGKNQQKIKPGFQAINNNGSIKIDEADIDNVIDWKDGDFYFENADFRSVMRKIARWYDVDIVYEQNVPENITSNGVISRNNKLSAVLKSIEKSGQVHFKIENKKIVVSK